MCRRCYRVCGLEGGPVGVGRGDVADKVHHYRGIDDDGAQRPTSSSSSLRAAATRSGPVGPAAVAGPSPACRWSKDTLSDRAADTVMMVSRWNASDDGVLLLPS